MSGIAVGVVLYNPEDIKRLVKGLAAIKKQVKMVYVFDNSTENVPISFSGEVIYLSEKENKGIAYALNRIMERASEDGFEWLVTVDQDSILPENYIQTISEYTKQDENIGIICPQVIDTRRSYMTAKKEPEKECVEFCITSASCTRISIWRSVGGFDEWLFIDLVDNDFCKRVILSGYKIIRINGIVLDQEFGRIMPKSKGIQQFWNSVAVVMHNQNFAKFGYRKQVSHVRVYYTCRNILYCNKKYRDYGGIGYENNYNCKSFIGFLIAFVLPSILRAGQKLRVTKAVWNGFCDGRREKVLPWIPRRYDE